eukprot:245840_1
MNWSTLLFVSLFGAIYGKPDEEWFGYYGAVQLEPNEQPGPIVNNQPDVAPPTDGVDDNSWFEHKYIASTFNDHIVTVIMVSAAVFIALVCYICYRRKSSNSEGCYKSNRFNEQSDNAKEMDIERQPFNYQ